MDKAEYRIKLEQINSLAEAGDFKGAAAVVDTIDWRHVKSVRTLCMVGEIYEANKRYEDSKRVLQYAYKRSSISKTVLYRLAEINIRTGDYDDAKRFYNEFEQLSPHDTSRYILKYKLLRAEGATLDDQIAVLKEYKEREYTERWAYELAKLYMKNGQKQKCIEECDEMILWFAEGKYVTRAMELKMKLRALSDTQKKKYNDRYKAEEKETAEEAREEESMTAEERVSRAADLVADEEETSAVSRKEKKFSAADIIRKMDAAADETVSSALGEERTGTVAAMAQVAQKAAATQEAVEEAAKETASSSRVVKESAEQANAIAAQAGADLEEAAAWKAAAIEESAAETVRQSAAIKAAEEEAAKENAAAKAKAAALAKQFREQASAEAEEEAAWRAAAVEEAVPEVAEEAAAVEEAVPEVAEKAGAVEEITEDAAGKSVAASDEAMELVKESARQASDEAAEAAAWEAAVAANEAEKASQKTAVEETEGIALDEAVEEAAWIAAAKEAAESAAKSAEADVEKAETAAEEAAERVEVEAAEEVVEAPEVAEVTDEVAEVEAAEEAAETAVEAPAAETIEAAEAAEAAEETEEVEETPETEAAPISPEELARSADEEAERALQEMMASFLNEFAVSGDEYKMTTDIIPDEEETPEKVSAPEPEDVRNDPERMLGKETDESLGLTRTESFQEQLKKALEEGGNYEEANQIVIPEDLESPEDAARRTVMTAHGLEYDPESDEAGSEEGEEAAESEDTDADTAADTFDSEAEGEGAETEAGEAEDSDEAEGEGEDDADAAADGDEGDVTEAGDEGAFEENAEGQESDGEAAESEEAPEPEPEPEPVKPEPEIMERVEVMPRKFTEEERELFSYFSDIPGISEQVSLALADIHNNAGDKTSRSGNILIMGRQLSGKTRLADALICAACMDLNIEAAKVAKVIGEDLNEKDPAEVVDKMAGGFLLIEGAGSMSDDFVEGLNKAMEFRTDDLVVILEDEKADLTKMLGKHGEFAKKFTSRVIIPVFTNDELVTFARTYANEKGYKLDEMGTLALYTMIGENQTDNEPIVVGQVKKMVDRAIERSKGPKIASLFRKNASSGDGRNWLKEKDFRF